MHPTSASGWLRRSFAAPQGRIRQGPKRLEPAAKGTRENVFASLNLRDRSCYATFSREDRRTCNQGQFYTNRWQCINLTDIPPSRRTDNILWFQRIRKRMGFAERRAEGIWARRFARQSIRRARLLIPSSHDLACLVEPLAIHLDPTEPSGDRSHPT